jgi:tetratricopeptide (TPR) repeat protein
MRNKGAIRMELHELALLDFQADNEAAARSGYEEALRLARDLGNLSAEAVEMRNLADAYRRWGQTDEARTLLQDGLAISKRLNSPYQIGMTFMFLGRLEQQEGRTNAAIAQYRAALSALEPIQSSFAEEAREALRELGAEP